MKMVCRWIPVVALTLAAGCIKLNESLTLKEDGSGSLDVTYSIAEQTITQLKAMNKLRDQLAIVSGDPSDVAAKDDLSALFMDPVEDSMRKRLKGYEKFGITAPTVRVESRNAGRYVTLKLLFDNLANAAKADFFQEHGFFLSKNAKGNYLLNRPAEAPDGSTSMDFSDPESVKLLTPLLGGFKVVIKVNTPTKILDSNATEKAARSATWSFDFDKDPKAVLALQRQAFTVLFDGTGASLPAVKPLHLVTK